MTDFTLGSARSVVRDAMNGEYDHVDPHLRRAIVALATEVDVRDHNMAEAMKLLNDTMTDMKRMLFGATASFVLTLVAATTNLILS